MKTHLIPIPNAQSIQSVDVNLIPVLFAAAGERASYRFIEFFTANIHNPNTRQAYFRATQRFSSWCLAHGLELTSLNPVFMAKYIQELGEGLSRSSVKQHLAALRML